MNIERLNEGAVTAVTVMRQPSTDGFVRGDTIDELQDGNMLPRFCSAAGKGACAAVCQLKDEAREAAGVACAENNVLSTLGELGVNPRNFVLVAATKDDIKFGASNLVEGELTYEGYVKLPAANAFFFMPNFDMSLASTSRPGESYDRIEAAGMRMADCGAVNIRMEEGRAGDTVLGISHFSKPNMKGPSAFIHEFEGEKVSWAEKVFGEAIEHYSVDPATIEITLSAAVDKENFIFNFPDRETMRKHFTGWEELGFLHPQGEEDFDCIVDYREMIEWQIMRAAERFGIPEEKIKLEEAVDTGKKSLGHASHHWGSKGVIAEGRDMYVVAHQKRQRLELPDDLTAAFRALEEVVQTGIEKGNFTLDDIRSDIASEQAEGGWEDDPVRLEEERRELYGRIRVLNALFEYEEVGPLIREIIAIDKLLADLAQ